MAVDQAGDHEAPRAAERALRLEARPQVGRLADVDDPALVDGDGAVADHAPLGVHRHDRPLDEHLDLLPHVFVHSL